MFSSNNATPGRARWLVLAALAAAWLAAAVLPATAAADFGITAAKMTLANEDGSAATQAGSHPYQTSTTVAFTMKPGSFEIPNFDGNPKNMKVELPPGLVGNAAGVPRCSQDTFFTSGGRCPIDTMIGYAWPSLGPLGGSVSEFSPTPLFNLEPPPDMPAQFGFSVLGIFGAQTLLDTSVRSNGDYGVNVETKGVTQYLGVREVKVELWGVPAASSHDAGRCLFPSTPSGECTGDTFAGTIPLEAGVAPTPFLTLPTSCGEPLRSRFSADSWQDPATYATAETIVTGELGEPVAITGCDKLAFEPAVRVTPATHTAGAPSGYTVDLSVPQEESVGTLATAQLKDAAVRLPAGVTLSPNVADGLTGCSDGQLGVGTDTAPSCPAGSKIGSVRIDTPVLDKPMEGALYVGQQLSDEPESGQMFRMFLVAEGSGVTIKLPGEIAADPATGQLTATFKENPQLPFSRLHMELKNGPRAPLVNPASCGTYTTHGTFTSWAQPESPVETESSFTIDDGCGRDSQFSPGLEAGTENPVAGASSPFVLRVTGSDGEQNISRIDAQLPEGLLAKLAGVPLCGDAQAATGECPAGSQVGEAIVGVGGGSNPLYVPQPGKPTPSVYLAGPYNGAPYSLVVDVAAQAGPFDLGKVVVRSALDVDPVTTQVTVKSDPLPQVVKGVPVAYRDVRVNVNRPDFTINPTSCEEMSVDSTLVSSGGLTASPSSRFQVGDCSTLGFKPKLALKLSGKTHRSAHPALRAVLRMPKGDANIHKAVVTLPKTEFLENAHIRTVCTRVQFAADECPKASIYGHAKAWSPLLDQPLQGPVYLRSSNHTLPDLVASLDGQIHIDLAGRIDSVNERIRNTFWAVPDAPVSKFVLTMQGGKKGLLVNNTELCGAKPRASVVFTGQNGKVSHGNPLVKADCGKK